MSNLTVFNFVTLNGFFAGPDGDIGWAHDNEDNDYAADMLEGGNTLLFGRVTYEMMASFWPTPMATKNMPAVAEGMNRAEKIVFSRTLTKADWKNTRIVKGNIEEEILKLKKTSPKGMTVLGSGSIVTQLAQRGLVDEYQIMVHPVALGAGRPMFEGIQRRIDLKLTGAKALKSGNVLLTYLRAENDKK
jgi:dihydrofolate reductase